MCADRLFQVVRSLELFPTTAGAGEFIPERHKLRPSRLLVTKRTICVGRVLKVAPEILHDTLLNAVQEPIVHTGHCRWGDLGVRQECRQRRGQLSSVVGERSF